MTIKICHHDNILNNVQDKKLVLRKKQFCDEKKKFDVGQKVVCCRQKQVNVARKNV